ncbi:DNA alkylation repair protein [Methanococcoides sp. AM1]|uniref:DNA alkylation repair protein n=1 Tax=Methanococcoides sp. AM1 TaxID=1201011 RepID=UPI00108430A3|nr:DNA alkylation repair protein [Methanococcoides sp. AM1]
MGTVLVGTTEEIFDEIITKLEELSDPEMIEGMSHFWITPEKCYGVSIPELRKVAKETGKDHELALMLWDKGYRETMILASMVDDPKQVSEKQMEAWVRDFDYWEICDQCCMNLFQKTPHSYRKAIEWSSRKEEFVKRSGFVLMARMAVADKKAEGPVFEDFFPLIEKESIDARNFVKKAVNWALRQIGKRNLELNKKAIEVSQRLTGSNLASARWIGTDALKELTSEAVQKRLHK